MKRLVDFYTPSRNRYSHMDLTTPKISVAYTLTGIDLMNCLLELDHDESNRMLVDLFADISDQITAITSGRSVHDCLFNPQHMNSTQCQSYFLFIGRLSAYDVGIRLLNNLEMFKRLEHLATTTNNDCYVKLIVSSLDYSNPGPCRDLLSSVLKCQVESSRLYATQFLLVLLRAGISGFSDWGVRFLVNQLKDKARSVYLTALSSLHEACELESCLETLVKLNPNLNHLGEKGSLLAVRLLAISSGFQLLNKNDFVVNEVKRWDDYFNYRYVKLVEGETSDVLTLHQRDEDGKYDKRVSAIRATNRKDTFLPPHLYGQLARQTDGFLMLVHHGSLETMIQFLTSGLCDTDEDILKLKASLWALGHFGSTTEGLRYLLLNNCLTSMITLAHDCLVLSIRATSYYALGLISTTRLGADELFKLGWFCTRHNRHVAWPIIEEEAWDEDADDSLRLPCGFPDISSTLYYFDSGIKDVEGSTDDDTSESMVALPGDAIVAGPQKSLTLPANQNQPSAYHKRSLSESKTFEIIRAPDSKKGSFRLGTEIVRRVRNNSTTESTTSGVSSCDSVGGGKSVM
jgi:rapamycin-insensitive companion of mTOR